jgi:hypothetical protein
MEDIRVSTPVDGYSSPVQDWANKNKVKRMISPLWSFDIKEINNKTLFRAISLAKQIPSYFKPEIAKAIYENYNSKCILDISHGWGGRLLGAVTSKNTEAYIGIDPNIVVQDRLHCLIDDLSFSKDIELINDISENFYREESFDTVFSSIPYFSKERYIGDNQSYSNYKTFNSWMTSYLYPTLYNAWCSLKKDGVLIINVSNIKIRGIEYNICDPMNDFISDLYGAKEGTHFGVRIGIRPNTLVTKQKILCEPTWVWYKNK